MLHCKKRLKTLSKIFFHSIVGNQILIQLHYIDSTTFVFIKISQVNLKIFHWKNFVFFCYYLKIKPFLRFIFSEYCFYNSTNQPANINHTGARTVLLCLFEYDLLKKDIKNYP